MQLMADKARVPCSGERHELSELLDAATHRVNNLEAANVQYGSKEASLKDKASQPLLVHG